MNRYRVSGTRVTGERCSTIIRAMSAEDAWFIAEKRAEENKVPVDAGTGKFPRIVDAPEVYCIFTIMAPMWQWNRIEALR